MSKTTLPYNERGRHLFEDNMSLMQSDNVTALTVGGPGLKDLEAAAKLIDSSTQELLENNEVTYTDNPTDDEMNLTRGYPDNLFASISAKIVSRSTQILLKDPTVGHHVLQYGPRLGSPFFRDQLAKLLTHSYGDTVKSESLMTTSGATHGLHLTASQFFSGGGIAFVEDPTYFIAINMLKSELNMDVVSVKTTSIGIDLDHLEAQIQSKKSVTEFIPTEKRLFSSLLYLVPTFNNPRGLSFPSDMCERLINLAHKYNLLLFCDDVYNLLNFDPTKPSPKRLLAYENRNDSDYKGCVISNGTFSKILGPGLRLGWIEGGPQIMQTFLNSNILLSAGSSNHFTSEVIGMSLNLGLEQEHIQMLSTQLATRSKAVCKILEEQLPKGSTYSVPQGGYFIWITLPENTSAANIAAAALKEHKVRVLNGAACSPDKNYGNCIRISVSYYPEDILVDAVKKLCTVINQHI